MLLVLQNSFNVKNIERYKSLTPKAQLSSICSDVHRLVLVSIPGCTPLGPRQYSHMYTAQFDEFWALEVRQKGLHETSFDRKYDFFAEVRD